MLFGDAVKAARKHVEFAGHGYLHDQALALVNQIGVTLRPAGELAVEALKDGSLGGVDEKAVKQIQEAVSGGSFDRPTGPEFFIFYQDLFRRHVEVAANAVGGMVRRTCRQRGLRLKIAKIFKRVEQAVGVIDPDSRHQTFLNQARRGCDERWRTRRDSPRGWRPDR